MLIIKTNQDNFQQIIRQAVVTLKNGGTIVYSTETAYGLGADFLNSLAVDRIYRIKSRRLKKQLPVIVSSLAMAKKYVNFNSRSLALAKKHWPGPITLVLDVKSKIKTLNEGQKTLAVRVSANKIALALVKKLGRPLTATSANLSGQKACYAVSDVIRQFKKIKYRPDLIIDAGRLRQRQVSTIVRCQDNGCLVLRKGKIVLDKSFEF